MSQALKDFRRLIGESRESITHSTERAGRPLTEAKVAPQVAPTDQLRLSGRTEDLAWRLESSEDISIARLRTRRLAGMLEESGMGVTHLPIFDLDAIEALAESAAAKGSIHADVAKHHIKAVQASNVAMRDRHSSADVAHAAHKNASQLHRNAAAMMAKAGDHDTAAKHNAWADHHDAHAAHHKASPPAASSTMGSPPAHAQASSGKKVVAVAKDPFPTRKAMAPKKDTVVAPKDATIHWRPSNANEPAPTNPVKKASDAASQATGPTKAQNLGFAAHSAAKDPNMSHKDLGGMHTKAAHAHMIAAVKHFRSGDHKSAQVAFDAALTHAGHAKKHASSGMTKAASVAANASKPAPGPRAIAGVTRVRR